MHVYKLWCGFGYRTVRTQDTSVPKSMHGTPRSSDPVPMCLKSRHFIRSSGVSVRHSEGLPFGSRLGLALGLAEPFGMAALRNGGPESHRDTPNPALL